MIGRFLLLAVLLAVLPASLVAQAPATPSHLRSWTTDERPHSVGEIITVVISEQTVASDVGDARSQHDRSSSLDGSVDLGGMMTLPTNSASIGGSYGRDESNLEQIRRRDQFVGEVAVRVVEITPDGLLRIEGERNVKIDNRKRKLQVSGLVRPEDVSARGYVDSNRVAEADIVYAGGPARLRGGWIGRLLGSLWPF